MLFFQGFDFGIEQGGGAEASAEVPEHLQKEFKVVQLIDAYRKRGHLFTKTNPVRDRRTYTAQFGYRQFWPDKGRPFRSL